jgi:hypothetical protein
LSSTASPLPNTLQRSPLPNLEWIRVRKGNAAGHEVVVEVRDEQQQRIAMVTAGMRIERLASAGSEQDRYGHPK